MKTTMRFLAAAGATTLLALPLARADDKPYTEGHVWMITIVKVKYGMRETYLNEVLPLRKKIEDEGRKEGSLLSSHTLVGDATNHEDFDVLFMQEFKNWAAFDGMTARVEAILQRVIGSQDKQDQIVVKRTDVREVLGEKRMQELLMK
jgi:hypothetical protein